MPNKKTKKFVVKPRVKAVFDKTLENGGNITKAMRDQKYREATINNPKNVTRTKSWQVLLRQIPDQKLIDVLNDGLEANRQIGAMILIRNGKNGRTEKVLKDDEGMIEVPDHQTRHKFLETGLKMKGKLVEDEDEGKHITVKIINYSSQTKDVKKRRSNPSL